MNDEIKKLLQSISGDQKEEATAILAGLGFSEAEKSCKNMQLLIERGAFKGVEDKLVLEAADSPDPDLALNNLERLASCVPEDKDGEELLKKLFASQENLAMLCTLCGGSRFLTNIALRDPSILKALIIDGNISLSSSYEEKLDSLKSGLSLADDFATLQKVLRQFKGAEYLRIGLRDLLKKSPLQEVMAEISDLASASLQAAYEFSSSMLKSEYGRPVYLNDDDKEEEADFAVLGMGKFGGRDLNFSSDIDLIFLYTTERGETAGGTKGKISLHEYFVKLGKMIIKAINDVTEDGFVFRVDMELRPEGKSGDLACSLRSAEIYYESWGQTWERSAMLKARPVAGSIALGETFLELLVPFKYRKFLDFTAIEEIRAMKKKIDVKIARDDQLFRNLKLGTGGIREIEFFIQTIQLINGGKRPEIRERNSLASLERLQDAGLIDKGEKNKLKDAYIFLREVEHMLQIFEERQTHSLPSGEEELLKLARRVGYREDALNNFLEDHRLHTNNVKEIYSSLFHDAAEKLEKEANPEFLELLEGELDEDEAMERLTGLGFKEPASALKNLSLLWNGPSFAHFTEKGRSVLRRVAPLIFSEIISSPEPGMALNTFEKFISAVGARSMIYSLLAENHHVIKLLVGLFGTSRFLSNILLTHPETLDSLVAAGVSSPLKTKEVMRLELKELARPLEYHEDRLDIMRRFRNVEMLRIGINDIYGEIGLDEVSSQLSWLADVELELAYELALNQMKQRYGTPLASEGGKSAEAGMTVIGMGKLGGEEMAYSSDLDIIFVYEGKGETSGKCAEKEGLKVINNHDFFAKVGQAIISILSVPTREGFVFKVDTRLRPSGSSGPLVASMTAFCDYHDNRSQVWERQALIRSRVVAGNSLLGKEVMETIEKSVYGPPVDSEVKSEIDRMRKRMENELAKEKEGIYNVKTGKGGIVDIEFLVQYLILKNGMSNERLRTPNTGRALDLLREENVIAEDEYTVLSSGYKFLRGIENGLRIVHDQSVSTLDTASDGFGQLSKRLGCDSAGLIKNYKSLTGKVREIYCRHLRED